MALSITKKVLLKLASPFISQLLNNSSLSSLKPWDRFLNPIISMLGAAAATPIEFSIIAFRNISSLGHKRQSYDFKKI
uniref:Uncharacterized protein n=1 Tax=Oryza meridionalis TaxID=40149 RepID=A0A0E0DVU6_9ORYZ